MNRMSVNLSPEMEKLIDETAKKEGISKADVVRKAFALLQVSESEKKKGRSLGIISDEHNGNEMRVVGKIIGL
ncbi:MULTISPECIES: ribbon-helix-helix protein, CopG family [Morganellaceae]|uniref:ribbon-helix-helix protein, CopG family n=1 Tax=Morganellaceae TaxID=1903414 RepID=UPI001BB05B26|nr:MULTISPECIES: ribbon-helix-helix protein, CopG family [Morganellaceae]MBS3857587.1 ribbon-helix-helix protein, CopG family [Proteus mirabilis]MCT0090468.1 ribbon-helix-helix protein, CopG family [Proteus mirabilis]